MRKFYIMPVLVTLLLVGCGKKQENQTQTEPLPEETRDSLVLTMVGADGMTVLDILETGHQVGSVPSAMGTFVNEIDSVRNSRHLFWFYSVNNEMGNVAADKFETYSGDTIRWHFRFIAPEDKSKTAEDTVDSLTN